MSDQVPAAGSSDDVRDWLYPGESWFCEEHHQIALPPEDIPEGYEQICLDCNPDVLALAAASPLAAEGDAQALFPSGVAYSGTSSNSSVPSTWTNASTLIGEDQSIVYSVPGSSVKPYSYKCIRLVFSSSQSFTSGSYLWYYYGGFVYKWFNNNTVGGFKATGSFINVTSTAITDEFYQSVFSGSFSRESSGNTLYLWGNALVPQATLYIGSFYLASEQYTGDGTGGGGGGTQPGPEEPGFDDPDGWLGGLIDSIIEGIRELIDGISNIAGNIAKLPGLIADALRSMLNAIKNAITAIGNQISSAIEALGNFLIEGLKSLFIPSDGYFEGLASDMQAWLEDHLGLLVYPFTLVTDLASRIAAVQGGEPTAHIPEIAYTDAGDKYVLIEEQEVNLYEQVGRNETFLELHQLYLMAMDAAIGGALAFLAWKKFDQITGGSST